MSPVTGAELHLCFADNNQGGGGSTANNSEPLQSAFPGALISLHGCWDADWGGMVSGLQRRTQIVWLVKGRPTI